ncbi:MAG: hypothetical protein ACLFUL_14170, partial [Desulfobacteraceae bacterium]
ANIPWGRTPCQAGNGTFTGTGNIFEMLSNRLCVTQVMVLAYKAIEDFLKGRSANLLKVDGEQIRNKAMNGRLINGYRGGFLSLCKRICRREFSGGQFNEAFRFQQKQQTSADHVLKNTIGLSPIPLSANFLTNETSAFIWMCLNNPLDGCYIIPGD